MGTKIYSGSTPIHIGQHDKNMLKIFNKYSLKLLKLEIKNNQW